MSVCSGRELQTVCCVAKLKTEEQIFSDAILSLRKENTIMKFFGILKNENWNAREKEMRNLRQEFERL